MAGQTVELKFPTDLNGVTEVGIAAGSDDIVGSQWILKVVKPPPPKSPLLSGYNTWKTDVTTAWNGVQGTAQVRAAAVGPVFTQATGLNATPAMASANSLQAFLALGGGVVTDAETLHTEAKERYKAGALAEDSVYANPCPYTTKEAIRLWQSLVFTVVSKGWYVSESPYVEHTGPVARKPGDVAARQNAGFLRSQFSVNLLIATKVAWWLTNHHVGTRMNVIASYTGKVFRSVQLEMDTEEARKILWAAGKWMSTIRSLQAIGIQGLVPRPEDNPVKAISLKGAEDVLMRVGANPAGTAKVSTYMAVYEQARKSLFSVLIPPVVNIKQIREALEEVKREPARYHMGSVFLTGQPRLEVKASFDDEAMENLSGFVHAIKGASAIAKAEVLIPKADILGNMVYTTLLSVKVAMAQGMTDLVKLKLIAKLSGGHLMGGIALAEGRISEAQIEEAKAEAKAEAEAQKEKAKKEAKAEAKVHS